MKRRTFLQTTTLLGASLGATAKTANSEPLIIATWKNEKATIAGWNKLMETGKALDGVEAGADVPLLRNSGTIAAKTGGDNGTARAIIDLSGNVDMVENSGAITESLWFSARVSMAGSRKASSSKPHRSRLTSCDSRARAGSTPPVDRA